MPLIADAMNLYLQLLLLTVSGWVNRHQQCVIEYLQAENRALREQLGPKRIRRTDAQRRLLAEKARAVKSECLDRVIPLGERHLRHLLSEYVAHYHTERNHQSLGNELIEPIPANTNAGEGVVRRRARLGGLLSYYHREVA